MFMSGRMLNAQGDAFGPATPVAGPVIAGLEFARLGRRLEFAVAVADLPRLADLVAGDSGQLLCAVKGELGQEGGQEGDAFLVLSIDGRLMLNCQRCLEAMEYPLQLSGRLMLVPAGSPWPDEELVEDGFDAIEAGREMALLPLIEDEVLLALPIAPCHESCQAQMSYEEDDPSPFAVLAKLKKGV